MLMVKRMDSRFQGITDVTDGGDLERVYPNAITL